jgi:hypothetical protein
VGHLIDVSSRLGALGAADTARLPGIDVGFTLLASMCG